MNNCPQYVLAHYGVQKLGAVACPCGPLFKKHELAYQLGDLGSRVIVAAHTLLPLVDQVRGKTALEHVFAVRYPDLLPREPTIDVPPQLLAMRSRARELPAGVEDFLAVVESAGVPPRVPLSMDEVALMTYTSGTTGVRGRSSLAEPCSRRS